MKRCSTCGEEKPPTIEYFVGSKSNKTGIKSQCKKCKADYQRRYCKKNKEAISEKRKLYERANKDAISERIRKFRSSHKDLMREREKQYLISHKEHRQEYTKRYRLENKDSISEYHRQHRKTHRDKISEYQRKYNLLNKDKITIKNQKRRSRELMLPATLTVEQWRECRLYFNNSCAFCGEETFLEQEHFLAVVNNGEYSRDNIIPACGSCNRSKGPKDFFTWYPKFKYYSKKREKKILDYLKYKNRVQQLSFV